MNTDPPGDSPNRAPQHGPGQMSPTTMRRRFLIQLVVGCAVCVVIGIVAAFVFELAAEPLEVPGEERSSSTLLFGLIAYPFVLIALWFAVLITIWSDYFRKLRS